MGERFRTARRVRSRVNAFFEAPARRLLRSLAFLPSYDRYPPLDAEYSIPDQGRAYDASYRGDKGQKRELF